MKKALALLIVGVIVLAIGVGMWVGGGKTPVYTTELARLRGIPSYYHNAGAGIGAALTVFGLAMTAGGIVMVIKQRKS